MRSKGPSSVQAGPDRGAAGRSAVLALALVLAAGCNTAKGIRIDVTMGSTFKASVKTLDVRVSVDGGFKSTSSTPPSGGISLANDPSSGDLIVTFSGIGGYRFADAFSFVVDTGNTRDLNVSASALAFDDASPRNQIASATAPTQPLPAGGEARLALTLQAGTGNPDGGNPGGAPIDLADPNGADVTVKGATTPSIKTVTTVAICNLTQDSSGELVIGVPAADSPTTMGTGAVYVLPGTSTGTVDLSHLPAEEFHVYGVNSGDKLGAAVGCVDVNLDGIQDLVIGAPGAYGIAAGSQDTGRVYVIKGRSTLLNSTAIDLSKNQADIEWVGGATGMSLGTTVLATDMQGGGNAEILIAAPGEGAAGLVHLVSVSAFPAPATRAPQLLTGTVGHATFAGIRPSPVAIAIGNLDGDGTAPDASDVVLGYSGAASSRGAVYVFRNVDPGMPLARDVAGSGASGPQLALTGNQDNDSFGAAVLALDLWGGGPDLLVGAPGEIGNAGAVRIYAHDADFFTDNMPKSPLKVTASGRFGSALASVVSGGGTIVDLLVGAPGTTAPASTFAGARDLAGAIYFFEPIQGTLPKLLLTIVGAAASDQLGSAVAGGPIGIGGINGSSDTIGDLFAVAQNANGMTGAAYVRLRP